MSRLLSGDRDRRGYSSSLKIARFAYRTLSRVVRRRFPLSLPSTYANKAAALPVLANFLLERNLFSSPLSVLSFLPFFLSFFLSFFLFNTSILSSAFTRYELVPVNSSRKFEEDKLQGHDEPRSRCVKSDGETCQAGYSGFVITKTIRVNRG